MPQLGTISVVVSGDAGGQGITRFHYIPTGPSAISTADAGAAGLAVKNLYTAMVSSLPTVMTFAVQNTSHIVDYVTGLVVGEVPVASPPPAVTGTTAGNYSAGMGGRATLHTTTVLNRRLMRGTWYLVPLANNCYGADGQLNNSFVGNITSAVNAMLAAMAAANLELVVWHRPPKGTTTGGSVGQVVSVSATRVPAGLRSRRH